MRTAPVGLFAQSPYVKNIWDAETCDKQAFSVARDIGYLTHGHPDGYLPGAVLGLHEPPAPVGTAGKSQKRDDNSG